MVVEPPTPQFADRQGDKGKKRGGGDCQLGVYLGGGMGGDFFVVADPAADLAEAVAVIDVPGAVVLVIRDLTHAVARGLAAAKPRHLVPPGAQSVHQLCTREAFRRAKKNAKPRLRRNLAF